MNGAPHAGHMRGRVVKDLWFRYNTLLGSDVKFTAGWDTQGLPVELQAEKHLGITGGRKCNADILWLVRICTMPLLFVCQQIHQILHGPDANSPSFIRSKRMLDTAASSPFSF